jgi:hypothetical protein
MKKIIILLFCIIFIISSYNTIAYENNLEKKSNNVLNISYNWGLMIYLNGDNLLYQVQQQILEKIKNIGSTEEVHIAILHDSNDNGDTKLYYLEGINLVEQEWEIESNMADPNTLLEFVQKVKTDNTFNHDALIISTNKGSGWQGILWDDTNGDNKQITLPEFSNIFADITSEGNDKFDVLAIETCMAGMTENAYQFKEYAEYYIAYEDCAIAGYDPYSWPFEGPINDLINNPDMSSEEFSVNHLNYFEPKKFSMSRITTVLTVTKLNEISAVKTSLDSLADFFINHIDEYRDDIQNAIEDTRVLGELWYIDFYLDPEHFLNLLSINDEEFGPIKDAVINAYDEAVIACDKLDTDPVCGLSLHIPRRKADYDHSFRFDELLSAYGETEFAKDSRWDEFLIEFLDLEENNPPNKPTINGPSRGSPETEYEFILSTTDSENDEIYYYVDWNDGNSSGWLGPHEVAEEINIKYTWSEQGTYNVRVKAKDSDESEWETLAVRMPKNQNILSSWAMLIGKISNIEKDPNQRFRFLPIKMLEISNNPEDRFSINIIDENYGAYPCCGYIDPNEFKGFFSNSIIFGLWRI